jgi:hypothetical protein
VQIKAGYVHGQDEQAMTVRTNMVGIGTCEFAQLQKHTQIAVAPLRSANPYIKKSAPCIEIKDSQQCQTWKIPTTVIQISCRQRRTCILVHSTDSPRLHCIVQSKASKGRRARMRLAHECTQQQNAFKPRG